MFHLKLTTSKSHIVCDQVHAGAKVSGSLPGHRYALQCSENYAGRGSLTLAVGDKGFRRKSSHLSACVKAFLCQTYTVLTTCVESGALFSVRVFCNSIYKMNLLKNVAENFGVYPGKNVQERKFNCELY